MESKIRVLNEQTINQIAAGEVIENPSSVVKELVENSLDAGATEISVEVLAGGRQLIRVTDNGHGMTPDDAVLCFERHATSKIKRVDDIIAIHTMGFRGEAIPSIASISKFTLLTRAGSDEGTLVLVDGGKLVQACPAACPQGTSIEVKSLFFNVPVRKKFQRSPSYDANEVHKVMISMALANPNVSFKLISNQETLFHVTAEKDVSFLQLIRGRIGDLLGPEVAPAVTPIEMTLGEYGIQGYVGLPYLSRHNRTGQHLFINKRAVMSHAVSFAVRDGYGTLLPTKRHPVFILHLTMPGAWVDVNVHPQKKEVRLRQEHKLREALTHAVQEVLKVSSGENFTPFFFDRTPIEEPMKIVEVPSFTPFPPLMTQFSFDETTEKKDRQPLQMEIPLPVKRRASVLSTIQNYILIDPIGDEKQFVDGVCFVDQRAAHARIIFETLLEAQSKDKSLECQQLLIPITFQKSSLESAQIHEHIEDLNKMGIAIKQFGQGTFVVDAVPKVFGEVDVGTLIMELTEALGSGDDSLVISKELSKQAALAAGRAAITGDRKLSLCEAQHLIDQLMLCEDPFQCPSGKPTIVHFSETNIIKHFQKRP